MSVAEITGALLAVQRRPLTRTTILQKSRLRFLAVPTIRLASSTPMGTRHGKYVEHYLVFTRAKSDFRTRLTTSFISGTISTNTRMATTATVALLVAFPCLTTRFSPFTTIASAMRLIVLILTSSRATSISPGSQSGMIMRSPTTPTVMVPLSSTTPKILSFVMVAFL